METEVGGSDNDNAHSSIDVAADFRVGFLPLLSKQSGEFFNKVFASLRINHLLKPQMERSVQVIARGKPQGISSSSLVRGLLTLYQELWSS
jgi:hypothetical protein